MKCSKPKYYDRNLIVIGAGSAGLVCAYLAATMKAKITLIEQDRMGGDCLNAGCVPSKALIKSAKLMSLVKRADEFGIDVAEPKADFAKIMQRVHATMDKIAPKDSIERYTELGVECLHGKASLMTPWTVSVNKQTLSAPAVIIATGAGPFVPDIENLKPSDYVTSDNLWDLSELPKRLVILGGGAIACELGQAFSALGSEVCLVEMGTRIINQVDQEASALLTKHFHSQHIKIHTHSTIKRIEYQQGQKVLILENTDQSVAMTFDQLLIATGRSANVSGFGLEALDVDLTTNRMIKVNPYLQTNCKSIYACGDVIGPYQFTHTAAYQAWYATINALFCNTLKINYDLVPWAIFTDPEIAGVGLSEDEANRRRIAYQKNYYSLDDLDRAIIDGTDNGFIKVLTVPGKDKMLGVLIVGAHAAELLTEYLSVMQQKRGLNQILRTIHIYPTYSEANKFVAGVWRRTSVSRRLLSLLMKYHNWRIR